MRKIIAFCSAVAAVLMIAACSPSSAWDSVPTVYIVSAGLDYLNSGAADLTGCPDDALEFGSCLSDIYGQKGIEAEVDFLVQYSEEADKSARDYPMADTILGAISGIPATEDDLIIFYYSGHGALSEDGEAFLAVGSTDGDYEELPMSSVFSALDAKRAPAIAVIDACYSGAMAEEGGFSFVNAFDSIIGKLDLRTVKVIAASGADELSYIVPVYAETGELESHGALTTSILGILDWRHTSISTREVTVSGCLKTINGRIAYPPSDLTADDLFENLDYNWRYYEHTPVTNSIPVDIRII